MHGGCGGERGLTNRKTTAKTAGTAARITMDGARAASHTITRPFRNDEDETAAIK
jgi:hypothetical protein